MTIKTVKIDDGKYEFDLDERTGLMLAARRNGEPWAVAFDEWRFSKCFMAALSRIVELEETTRPKTFVEAAAEYNVAKVEFDKRFGAEIAGAAQVPPNDSICAVCDGGPGNSSECACGLKRWESLPVARGALESSIEEVEALSNSDDRDLTISECESMMLVLHELKRLQFVERQAVEIVAGATQDAPALADCCETLREAIVAGNALAIGMARGLNSLVKSQAALTDLISWRCFHCDEAFTDRAKAQEHFGTSLHHQPACQIDIAECRDMQARVERSNAEDSDVHRQMYGMQARHATALRREEETGYARGLKVNLGEDAMQRAAGDLPVGYDMRICLENGAGWIEIDDAEGNELTLETDTDRMTDRINESIDIAIAHAAAAGVKA